MFNFGEEGFEGVFKQIKETQQKLRKQKNEAWKRIEDSLKSRMETDPVPGFMDEPSQRLMFLSIIYTMWSAGYDSGAKNISEMMVDQIGLREKADDLVATLDEELKKRKSAESNEISPEEQKAVDDLLAELFKQNKKDEE